MRVQRGADPRTVEQLQEFAEYLLRIGEELQDQYMTVGYMTSCTILALYNNDVRTLNDAALECFPGNIHEYLSFDKIVDSEAFASTHPPEYLHTINLSNYPPHKLSLKLHQLIMPLRNINPRKGLCNGT
ncbi:hypothetical protein INT45_005279 [Circinella minor]|uniref:DNA helicase Pif1-like 2B domain-containing protein n=1 Tax=Circinella minor TaxID=1195481 RepID=A0A8H7S8G2_9FUNG|nr:hypothetical protein INT45_005279 [Circinella minor]